MVVRAFRCRYCGASGQFETDPRAMASNVERISVILGEGIPSNTER